VNGQVTAAVDAKVLVGGGWTSMGMTDKRIIIDINDNKMGTVLVDERFLSRSDVGRYLNSDYDTITIRCRIHVFEDSALDACIPPPNRVRRPPKIRRDSGTIDSNPAKRRRLR